MLKYIIHIFFPIFFLVDSSCSNVKDNVQKADSVRISFVNLNINTMSSVGCSDFDTLFESSIKTVTLTEKKDIKAFEDCQDMFIINPQENDVDVRVKVSAFKNGKPISLLCFDGVGNVILANRTVYKNQFLFDFIKRKIGFLKIN